MKAFTTDEIRLVFEQEMQKFHNMNKERVMHAVQNGATTDHLNHLVGQSVGFGYSVETVMEALIRKGDEDE